MKIRLIEGLGISDEELKKYSEKLEKEGHDFKAWNDVAETIEEQKRRMEDCDILMIVNHKVSGEMLEVNKNLKLINVAFTGFDHVAMDYANKNGIKVCNASGYSTISVSELIIGMLLQIYRKIKESDEATRKQKTQKDYYEGLEISGKKVGIVGTGDIGSATAKLFSAFGAEIYAYSRTEKEELKKIGVKYIPVEELFSICDVISINLPLNGNTRGMIGEELIGKMKTDAVLINCARGPIVDSKVLAQALNEEKIAYAAIDVFDEEPPIPADNPLLNCKNILLTPHIAFLTSESMLRRAEIAFNNTETFIEGNPTNLVN